MVYSICYIGGRIMASEWISRWCRGERVQFDSIYKHYLYIYICLFCLATSTVITVESLSAWGHSGGIVLGDRQSLVG